jgi:peptide deformylase
MALRNIRLIGDEILYKKAKPVKEMTDKLEQLIDDMLETMYNKEGVGLAATQVGVLKQIVVIDASEEGNEPIVLINPEVTFTDGEQDGTEGCLSVPGKVGYLKRPNIVRIKARNRKMEPIEIEGEGLLARAFIHEIEHLAGELYVDKVEGKLYDSSELKEELAGD